MRRKIFFACLIWTVLTAASFSWNYRSMVAEQKNLSLQTARSLFQQIVLFRSWNAMYAGVYVPVTSISPPNPYLHDSERDIVINNKVTLTRINPAYMTRQISELSMKKDGIKFHITSLNPIRPENRPSPMEELALKEFETGITEKGEMIITDKGKGFFYMASLMTEKSCLRCHAKQGYKEGDIRGGISVTIPYVSTTHIFMLLTVHLFMLAAGLTGLIFAGIKLSDAYNVISLQAAFDALTGIPNRHSFSDRIISEFKRSMRDKSPLSVIMCDIDNFKLYNDTYGHLDGDECLKRVAKSISETLKRPGDFCARYGGEEFVVILPATDLKGAVKIAEDIRKNVLALDIPHEKSTSAEVVTLSLGATEKINDTMLRYEDLLKMADDALYQAKEKGRNRVEVSG